MRRRSQTQKRGRRGSGARSALARRGALRHRRRPGSRRQTFARLSLCECPGPGGGPPHSSERAVLALVPSRRWPFSLLPTFWPGYPRRRSESRPGRSPPPRGGSHCATLLPPKGGGAPSTKGPGLQATPPRAAATVGDGWGPAAWPGLGDGGPVSLTGLAEPPPPPPPPTQLTCHPRPRYSGQRDSGRKSHSGSPLIGPVRAAAPSLRGGSAGLDWTPALSVRPLGRAFPPTAGTSEGLVGSATSWRPGASTWSEGGWGEAAESAEGWLGCAGDVCRPAVGRGAVRTCVSVRACVRSSTGDARGETSNTLYRSGREWMGATALYRVHFLTPPFPQWADAVDAAIATLSAHSS